MKVQPYLLFNGSCEQAIEFYRHSLGAEVEMVMRYRESPEPPPPDMLPPGYEDKIMHASLRVGDTVVMASDGCGGPLSFDGFSLSIDAKDAATAECLFGALADGGEVKMPMTRTFWSPRFGMLKDRFGVAWMVSVAA